MLVAPPEDSTEVAAATGHARPVVDVPVDSVHVADSVLARRSRRRRAAGRCTSRGGGTSAGARARASARARRTTARDRRGALAARTTPIPRARWSSPSPPACPCSCCWRPRGGYLLARKSLRPWRDDRARGAHRRGEPARAVPVERPGDELGRLAAVLNELLERVATAFEQQRQLIADASHELRTPVAILSSEAELALARERSPAEFREALTAMHEEARRLQHVVEDLFLLARANAGERLLVMEELYVDELAADCVEATRALAARKRIELHFRGSRPAVPRRRGAAAPAAGQPARQRDQVHPAGGAVHVRTRAWSTGTSWTSPTRGPAYRWRRESDCSTGSIEGAGRARRAPRSGRGAGPRHRALDRRSARGPARAHGDGGEGKHFRPDAAGQRVELPALISRRDRSVRPHSKRTERFGPSG